MRRGLIAARVAKGWTQFKLAAEIDKERSTVARYETGNIDIPSSVSLLLSHKLNVPIEILVALDTTDTTPVTIEEE